jgi:hypothetical protein
VRGRGRIGEGTQGGEKEKGLVEGQEKNPCLVIVSLKTTTVRKTTIWTLKCTYLLIFPK